MTEAATETSSTRLGLDGVNFFVAAAQTGFGPLIAVYLSERGWYPGEIGFVLTVGTIASLFTQLPAGLLVDAMGDKRRALLWGIIGLLVSALMFVVWPTRPSVYVAEIVHGFAGSMLTPALAAVTLGLVGRTAFGARVGRNASASSIGNGLAVAVMGAAGSWIAPSAVFWLTAALCVPAWIALRQ